MIDTIVCARCGSSMSKEKIADSIKGAVYQFSCRCGYVEYEPKGTMEITNKPFHHFSREYKDKVYFLIREIFDHPETFGIYSWVDLAERLDIEVGTLRHIGKNPVDKRFKKLYPPSLNWNPKRREQVYKKNPIVEAGSLKARRYLGLQGGNTYVYVEQKKG